MLFVQVFVVVIKKIVSEIERVYRLHHRLCRMPRPELIAATKFKNKKINFGALFGLSTKITHYTVFVSYYALLYVFSQVLHQTAGESTTGT